MVRAAALRHNRIGAHTMPSQRNSRNREIPGAPERLRSDRASGILLHPTSLPSRYGIGDFGASAREFVDFLYAANQRVWHILPLGPTGDSNSPYECRSSFAGNPLLISPELLADRGYIAKTELRRTPRFNDDKVSFAEVRRYKLALLRSAFMNFERDAEFTRFERVHANWLEQYATFMALREANEGACWIHFDAKVRPSPEHIAFHKFVQFEFSRQWESLRHYCRERGIRIVGDLPFYVQHDSADVWASPELFDLTADGAPRNVGGVPPDAFTDDGQFWGNPTYQWDRMKRDGFAWWIARLSAALERVDILRLDHFRGFESYWRIPASSETARGGAWVKTPGMELFRAARKKLGELPLLAENLGVITPEVEKLRNTFGLPGMAVLQFAFDSDNSHRPHNYSRNTVAFTGTHDNNTTEGWWEGLHRGAASDLAARAQLHQAQAYLQSNGHSVHWAMIRTAMNSIAQLAIIPLQDVLGLGSEARMNIPGTPDGNWTWRFRGEMLTDALADRLAALTVAAGRHRRDAFFHSGAGAELRAGAQTAA
jgi:4-alpha-glucanotransferase